MTACVYRVTKGTGMFAIKSLADRDAEWLFFRVLNQHRSPGQRLKRNPMQTDRETERADRCDSPKAPEHADETSK